MNKSRFVAKAEKLSREILPQFLVSTIKKFLYGYSSWKRDRERAGIKTKEGFHSVPLQVKETTETLEFYLDLDERLEFDFFKNGILGPEPDLINRKLKDGDVFYDIGAHVGFFTILGSILVGDEGEVYAFEPSLKNLKKIRKTIQNNSLRNVYPFQRALSDSVGSAQLHLSSDPSLHSLVRAQDENFFLGPKVQTPRTIDVQVTTLDNLVYEEGLPFPDFVKIDVEGAETRVLSGMQKLVEERSFQLLLSVHEQKFSSFGTDKNEFFKRLSDLTTDIFYLKDSGKLVRTSTPPYENVYELFCEF